jgi:hypothetical protein
MMGYPLPRLIHRPVCLRRYLVRFAHNWNNGKMEYWARSEALALYWAGIASH